MVKNSLTDYVMCSLPGLFCVIGNYMIYNINMGWDSMAHGVFCAVYLPIIVCLRYDFRGKSGV